MQHECYKYNKLFLPYIFCLIGGGFVVTLNFITAIFTNFSASVGMSLTVSECLHYTASCFTISVHAVISFIMTYSKQVVAMSITYISLHVCRRCSSCKCVWSDSFSSGIIRTLNNRPHAATKASRSSHTRAYVYL